MSPWSLVILWRFPFPFSIDITIKGLSDVLIIVQPYLEILIATDEPFNASNVRVSLQLSRVASTVECYHCSCLPLPMFGMA